MFAWLWIPVTATLVSKLTIFHPRKKQTFKYRIVTTKAYSQFFQNALLSPICTLLLKWINVKTHYFILPHLIILKTLKRTNGFRNRNIIRERQFSTWLSYNTGWNLDLGVKCMLPRKPRAFTYEILNWPISEERNMEAFLLETAKCPLPS